MAKVTVTAKKDFYDGGNSIPRTKGSTFILKSEYAKSLGNLVTIGESISTPAPVVEKKEKGEAKDITMENIKREKASPVPVPKAKKTKSGQPAKKKGGK